MQELLYSNFVTVVLIIGLSLELATSKLFEKKVHFLFAVGITIILTLVIIECLEYRYANLETLNNVRYVLTTLGYLLKQVTIAIFIRILLRKEKKIFILYIPIGIEAVLLSTSFYTHLIFYYDEYNNFLRGPLGFLPHIIGFTYLFILGAVAMRMYNKTNIGEMITVLYILIICSIATILETFLSASFLLTGAMASSSTIYYIYLYVQLYNMDIMTGLLNRRSFYTDSEKLINDYMSIISVDLNGLKSINDILGHAEGDKAICAVANIMKKVGGKNFRVYRTGGDEFMVIGQKQDIEKAQGFVDEVIRELSKTKYSASYGIAIYNVGDNFDEVCITADMRMYENKKMIKLKMKEISE